MENSKFRQLVFKEWEELKKILYIYNTDTTWTRRDLNILKTNYEVDAHLITGFVTVFPLLNPLKIREYDICVFWFASLQFLPIARVARWMGSKIVIVAGGYDVVNLPSIDYGAFTQSAFSKMFRRMFFRMASLVISISKSNQNESFENANVQTSKSVMIYHGFEKDETTLIEWSDRKKQVITVGEFNEETYLRKGHKYFIELATEMSEWNFILIGKIDKVFFETLNLSLTDNLRMTGFIDQCEFSSLINESKYYAQLSQHEGFGCSVIEATLLGCYPIVFDSYALPEIVEGMGKVLPLEDLKGVKEFIETDSEDHDVWELRKFYEEKFAFENRSKQLIESLKSL